MVSETDRKILKKLYTDFKDTGRYNCLKAKDIYQELKIPDGTPLNTLHNSGYVSINLDGTHECLKLTISGIHYMEDLTLKTDEELEEIIRRAENMNVPGSLFNRAKLELELRDRRRQGEHPRGNDQVRWYNNWLVKQFINLIKLLIVAFLIYKFGWK